MTGGEDRSGGAATGDAVSGASAATAPRRRSAFSPVDPDRASSPSPADAAAHDHLDTDEFPPVVDEPAVAPAVDAAHPFGEDDAADPVVEDASDKAADTEQEPAGPGGPPPRPAALIVTIAIMTVLIIGGSAMIAYLWRVAEAWEAQVVEITAVSYGLGQDLASEREALAAAEARIELLNDQLAASKDTVTRLQAENAQWGDDAAFAQEEIAALETLIVDSTAVANSLSRCIEGHDQLLVYLDTPDDFDEEEIATYRESVEELCTSANEAHRALQLSVAP